MKVRRIAMPWLFGLVGALLLVALACGSTTPDDGDVSQAPESGAIPSEPESSGVLVTDAGADDAGEAGPWIGAEIAPVPATLAGLLGLPAGERVAWVTPGGPADGVLILGDTITTVDGDAVDANNRLAGMLAARTPGESVSLVVLRGGQAVDVQITLAAQPVHGSAGSLAEIQGLFDRALSGELRFLDSVGGERSVAFASGTLSGLDDDRVSLIRSGSGPMTVTLSPNVFIWIDGSPGAKADLADATGQPAKVVTLDDVALAVLTGGIIPPALEALEGVFGSDADGNLGGAGGLESLLELFGAGNASAGGPGF
ncbi:MAG: PDZ domain-containing protein [Dehalococcoidia bacterium]|nr:PDZ domain-containing protein [Dehalococcoidia bacterium]